MRKTSTLMLCGIPAVLMAAFAAPPLQGAPRNRPLTVTARQPATGHAVERVSYADLNLASARDQHRLNRRVSHASTRVCSPQALGVSVSDEDFADCSRTALSGARPQVAQAIQRAIQIAATGTSTIPVVAIAVAAHF